MSLVQGNLTGNISAGLSSGGSAVSGSSSAFGYLADTAATSAGADDTSVRWNNATQASATSIFLDVDTTDGATIDSHLAELILGGYKLRITLASDLDTYQEFAIDSITDNTTFFTFTVTLAQDNGGDIADNVAVFVSFISTGTDADLSGEVDTLSFDTTVTTALIGGRKDTDAGAALNALGANSISILSGVAAATNIASGAQAIGIGHDITANAASSIALGDGASATGADGVAIGSSTSVGLQGVAIGLNATAVANSGSTALGNNCDASGDDSLAAGKICIVDALSNEGVALGDAAEAATTVIANASVIEAAGTTTVTTSSAHNLITSDTVEIIGADAAFNGVVTVTVTAPTIYTCVTGGAGASGAAGSTEVGASKSIAIGSTAQTNFINALALGNASTSSGRNSIAFGAQTDSTGFGAVAIGGDATTGAQATDVGSISIGGNDGTNAAASASAANAIAIGQGISIAVARSLGIGLNAAAGNTDQVVIGSNATGGANARSIAIGGNPTASTGATAGGNDTIAVGSASDATAAGAIAIGADVTTGAQATTAGAVAIGSDDGSSSAASAGGTAGVAIGTGSNAGGALSVSIGHDSSSAGINAVAIGTTATAARLQQVIIGDQATTTPTTTAGMGVGLGAKAQVGDQAVSIGMHAKGNAESSVAIGGSPGASNETSVTLASTGAIAIGGGTNLTGGRNGARVTGTALGAIAIGSQDGTNAGATSAATNGIAIGAGSNTNTSVRSISIGLLSIITDLMTDGIAIGANTSAGSDGSIAIGGDVASGASASGSRSIAIGGDNGSATSAAASGNVSIAIGSASIADSTVAIALGADADATASAAIAIGSGSDSTGTQSIAIGGTTSTGAQATANRAIAIGADAINDIVEACVISACPMVAQDDGATTTGGWFRHYAFPGGAATHAIPADALATFTATSPTNAAFHCTHVGVKASGGTFTSDVELEIGSTADVSQFKTAGAVFGGTPATGDGVLINLPALSDFKESATLRVRVSTAATGTAPLLRVFFFGMLVRDE